ncbi:beta-eliminating lyase-related protein [Neisseriaceae bacterium ESL0693]|nr:beta-eliminating lyase-related protein [Neisseriaceae bacterium ESL0693]
MNRLHDPAHYTFASDNYSGVHPRILAALNTANGGSVAAYGDDIYTQTLQHKLCELFGHQARAFPMFNGTGANVTALQALVPRCGAVICAESAHINVDEGVAPEHMGGIKLLSVKTPDGKLTPALVATQMLNQGIVHHPQARLVYISQPTEYGTCYRIDEIQALADYCHQHEMKLYVDGARLANAVVSLNTDVKTMITDTGVDMLNLGGTKNGLLQAECLISLCDEASTVLPYLRKSNAQLSSKMRFISAQFLAWFEQDLWLQLARHSNSQAQRLAQALTSIETITITQPVEANAVFARLPAAARQQLHQHYHFYDWDQTQGEVRWMTSFDTLPEHVDQFIMAIKQACNTL